ncbi:uncharacterized protein N7477_005467 [Penicillium maclennaniae]|uniref:uncharacterized protein n=1 Tax=Penicillium maclennaniae TaxID=1343394 RepID=UPI00254074B8|nr:uncharacterized protein N7477_005467 [Penicillium maclennaniae]KAJ5670104.1 hypothetical protein N7477_005467 [Penicillium maclennaniae]
MPPDDAPRFAFVSEFNQADARSHAMREHWRQRHSRNNSGKHKRIQPRLLPSPISSSSADRVQKSRDQFSRDRSTRSHGSQGSPSKHSEATSSEVDLDHANGDKLIGITPQFLNGMGHALSTSRLDPFQQFPVELTPQHHKLLHHWIGTHATMMFEDLGIPTFNPMKDVWFPLDLSNASSFNAIMAHSAAHLSHLYAGTSPQRATNSSDALKYKSEAVRILHEWVSIPEKALSYDAFAAVIRLLTFERYWGTAEEWNIHRTGLQNMIEAKGGIGELHGNWGLELVVYLWVARKCLSILIILTRAESLRAVL